MSRYTKNYGKFYCDVQALHPEVTGSCLLCVVKLPDGKTFKFLVDCGLFQEEAYRELNKILPFKANDVSFVLVTHNHIDHVGRLALLARRGYCGKFYASEDTCRLLPLSLRDSARIVASNCKAHNELVLYEDDDVNSVIENLQPVVAREQFQPHENVVVTALRNNHLVGAFSYLVQIKYSGFESINILFTGDLKTENVFLEEASVPTWIRDLPLTIVTESTYGHEKTTGVPEFNKNIKEALDRGGTVIVPVISLGRTQEILYVLKQLQKEGMISSDIPIYLDGKLAIKYTNLYLKGVLSSLKPSMVDFLPENFHPIDGDKKAKRRELKADSSQKIILCSSGMGTFGSSPSYIQHYIQQDKALIHFCCYCTENSVGRSLKEAEEGTDVEVCGLTVEKKAEVKYTDEFSGHAHEKELIEYLSCFNDIKLIAINHGEKEAKRKFAHDVFKKTNAKHVFILDRQNAVRINSFGFEKSLPLDFNFQAFRTKF
jgi:metallo-beta-lactamase family protein